MAEDLSSAEISAEFVMKAIRAWRTGELVRVRKHDFTSSGRTYLEDRKPGTIDPTEARYFPKTPQLRMLAEELAEIARKEAEQRRKQEGAIQRFTKAEENAERALADHGLDSAEYRKAFDERRLPSPDGGPRKDLPRPGRMPYGIGKPSARTAALMREAGFETLVE
jgi:hypothetical protein